MKSILMIGNHFINDQNNPNVWHELALQLRNWKVITVSDKQKKFSKLLDMLWIIYSQRSNYQIVEVDVFSGPAFIWAEWCVLFLKFLNKRLVLTLHGGNLPEFAEIHPRRLRRVLGSAEKVVSPSSYLQKALRDFRDDIQVIPNPIDIESHPYRFRRSIEPKLIWVRSFHEIYNPSLAVKLLNQLIKKFPNIHLTMAGPDKGDGSFQGTVELAKSMGILNCIEFVGGVAKSEVPKYLNKNDIFLNTTNYDNTPLSILEAMACGLPIVTTNVGGIPWLVEDGVDGLLVPPDDPEAMAKAVGRILTEPGLAEKLSANARKKAEGYDWSLIMPMWEKLFSELIEGSYG